VSVGEAQCAVAIGIGTDVMTAMGEDVPSVAFVFDDGEQLASVVEELKAVGPCRSVFVTCHVDLVGADGNIPVCGRHDGLVRTGDSRAFPVAPLVPVVAPVLASAHAHECKEPTNAPQFAQDSRAACTVGDDDPMAAMLPPQGQMRSTRTCRPISGDGAGVEAAPKRSSCKPGLSVVEVADIGKGISSICYCPGRRGNVAPGFCWGL
jgi:hypothetical protein